MSIRPGYRPSPLASLADINWLIAGIMTFIAGIGFSMMISAAGGSLTPWAIPQMVRFMLAFMLMLMIALMPMRILMEYAYLIYIVCLLVLLGVDIFGHINMGARRWLTLGGLNIQPSEFMKLAVILALARYFHQTYPEDIRRLLFLIPPALMIALPAVLILKEPNLGTTIILALTGGVICFLAGVRWRYFIILAATVLACLPVVWHLLHDYQKQRVLTFLNPDSDPLGAGYNILQSMIAIGLGGFFGKGYLHGTQSQLDFLPEKHTDFIFTVLAEEFGFFGCLILLGLYAMLLASGMMVAGRSRSTFGSLMAAGVVALIFMHILINCGMVMDLLPVVGVPLPLMSYGGSITVSTVLAIGLLQNAWVHRDELPLRLTPKL